MNIWKAPWGFHGKRVLLRTKRGAEHPRLSLEVLEDRLALSSSPIGPQPIGPTDWRSETFSIEKMTPIGAPIGTGSSLVQSAASGMGEGFGQDIGLDKVVAQYPYRGDGYSVAIIDTGIDYNNAALGGGWGKRVLAGYNFVNNTSDPMDDNGHGTHVAGIIGSSDPTYTGVAPDVNFIALKVLDSTGSGTFGAVDQALQWVAAHQAQYHIVAINMSLGSGNYTANPYTYLENDFSTLKSEGVFIASASGNSFYTVGSQQGLAYPAISPQVVSVGAVWDGNFGSVSWVSGARDITTAADYITSFTQRSSGLDILAPGAMITSTYLNNTFKQMAGTSMATPVTAGAAVLLHQALDARDSVANQDTILSLMQTTGVTIVDNNAAAANVVDTGLSFKRLDLFAALNKVGAPAHTAPTLGAIPTQTMTAGVPLVITLSAASASGGTLTFHAQATANATSAAYQLGQQLGLGYAGSYLLNSIGQNEKWILGAQTQWYCLLPNGDLRRWMGDVASTLAPGGLVANLTTAVYNDPTQLWTPPASTNPAVTFTFTGNQVTLQCDPNFLGSFTVVVSASDGIASASQSFIVNVTRRAAHLGAIANQTISHSLGTLTVNLAVSNPDNDALAFSAVVLSPSQQVNAVAFAFSGNQLVVTPAASVAGTFAVQVTLTDGSFSFKQTFNVAVTESAPVLGAVAAQTVIHGKSLTVALNASDADGDALTLAAQTVAPSQQALNLEHTLGLKYNGNYFTNYYGQGEKWLFSSTNSSASSSPWYYLLPDGSLRHAGTTNIFGASSPVATLDANYYVDPSLLWNAQNYVVPQVTFTRSGNQLTIQPPANFIGTFTVQVAVSDGFATVNKSFTVSVTNAAPTLGSAAAQPLVQGQGTLVLTVPVSDADGDHVILTAVAIPLNKSAAQPRVTVVVQGNQLTITPVAGYKGTFYVEVTASDGVTWTMKDYQVTI